MWENLEWLKKVVESGTRVKLAPGVIGKSAMMWNIAIVAWIVALARLSPTASLWYNGMILGGAALLTFVVRLETRAMRGYAEKNPGTALLEGAELTEFTRMEAQAKGLSSADKSPIVSGSTLTGTAPPTVIRGRDGRALPQEPAPDHSPVMRPVRVRRDEP